MSLAPPSSLSKQIPLQLPVGVVMHVIIDFNPDLRALSARSCVVVIASMTALILKVMVTTTTDVTTVLMATRAAMLSLMSEAPPLA